MPLSTRFSERNIHLTALARNSTVKKHGLVRVLYGVDQLGVQHDEPCFARDANELYDGVFCIMCRSNCTLESSACTLAAALNPRQRLLGWAAVQSIISPRDLMHDSFDGVMRHEAAWLIYDPGEGPSVAG